MNKSVLMTLLLALCLLSVQVAAGDYRISAQDKLTVKVFGEDDLSVEDLRVSADGNIAFPLLGVVKVVGLNARQLEKKLTELLADGYLVNPRVSVSISSYRLLYVRGEVNNPGGYPYQEGLTVQKVIALAGGFTERASESKISLASEEDPDTVKDVGLNHSVTPGDIITVGESFF
ncbi:MAG: polysaccharide export protein [gamma proteobacterium symbiont of Bathyaustriella thionipta]|nr:polysaccharide export protein [gamma proteobacterium symbiont of Bathyaustriella thionipta]